ncbi:hypothetical protein [Fibrobacter succinogenes]|uniref:hypothetical protein n=1 Tax=Fibrobacter succinogenes TaxID=833 RepID=UPI0015675FDC|nr:hypothetical protein [Fibrobacter succinogenes]
MKPLLRKQKFIEKIVNSAAIAESPPLLGLEPIGVKKATAGLYKKIAQVNLFHIRRTFCLLLRQFEGLWSTQTRMSKAVRSAVYYI